MSFTGVSPLRDVTQNNTVGGLLHTALKNENGATLATPDGLMVEIHPIGRGTMAPIISLYIDCCEKADGSHSMSYR